MQFQGQGAVGLLEGVSVGVSSAGLVCVFGGGERLTKGPPLPVRIRDEGVQGPGRPGGEDSARRPKEPHAEDDPLSSVRAPHDLAQQREGTRHAAQPESDDEEMPVQEVRERSFFFSSSSEK